MTATIPARHITRLAPQWHTVSLHEAGHVVGGLLAGVPVYEVWLGYRHHGGILGGQWTVVGRTEVAPDGGTVVVDDDAAVLFTIAGLEAETLWVAHRDRMVLSRARDHVYGRPVNAAGDVADLVEQLSTASISIHDAQRWALSALRRHWDSVETVAAGLREHGHLTRRDIEVLL